MSDYIIKLENVSRTYCQGNIQSTVLKDVSLGIKKGEMVAIIGPSGSGKSTLMNILGCLDRQSEGSYEVDGIDTNKLDAMELASLRRSFFGFIFQRYHLLAHLSALENVQVPAIYSGVKKEKRDKRAMQLLESLSLASRHFHKPSELSGGQQQRVSIARALMNGGQIILADEPTGALDKKSGVEVMQILKDLHQKGHTVIIVTHDINIALQASRIISIEDGRIVKDEINTQYQSSDESARTKSTKDNALDSSFRVKQSWATSTLASFDRFKEALNMALMAMNANRLRTLLTMLGIIIGIMAVISVVALARGASDRVMANIASLGTNTISIYPGTHMGDVRMGLVRTLSVRDLNALAGQPYTDSATPSFETTALFRNGSLESNGTVKGASHELYRVSGLKLRLGRFISAYDVTHNQAVCTIDHNTYINLFKNINPLGQVLLVNKVPLRIVGVLEKSDSPFVHPGRLQVYIPYTVAMSRVSKQDYLSSIVIRIKDGFDTAVAEKSIVSLLTSRHGRKDFFIFSSDSIMRSASQANMTFTLLISAIAVISLIVGGIGVMNIMLVSVTERTREIGIRMAVGARESDIMVQFLIEAVAVCLLGGLLGVLLSYGLGIIVGSLSDSIVMSFSLESIIAAVVTSTLIGVGFGFMPARSASRLNPIEALSRE